MRAFAEQDNAAERLLQDAGPMPMAAPGLSAAAGRCENLRQRLNRLDEGFPQVLLRLTDGQGMTDAACYSNRALIAGVFAFDQSHSEDCTGDGGSLYL